MEQQRMLQATGHPSAHLLEDLFVAQGRMAAALKRTKGKRSKDAEADRVHHRAHVDLYLRLMAKDGGEAAAPPDVIKRARSWARRRLKLDLAYGCRCGQIVGVTRGACPR